MWPSVIRQATASLMRPALVRQFVRLPLAAMQPAAAAAACSRPAARSLAICAAAAGAAGLAAAATTGAAHAKAVSASPAQRAMDKDLVEHARRVGPPEPARALGRTRTMQRHPLT